MDKFNDFRVAYQAMQGIEERLSQQFMLQSSVQRNGERVTAEEIRYLAGELEDTLSGIYSILSQEFQLPYVNRKIDVLTKAKKLPKLPDNVLSYFAELNPILSSEELLVLVFETLFTLSV